MRRGIEALPSPNIWQWPELYELENQAQDVGGDVWRMLSSVADWAARDVVDIGCGAGFHLPRFAATARHVTGVEPHAPLVKLAQNRVAGMPTVEAVLGSAQHLPLPDASVDVAHARTAYFFGPGCEPGLAEADRVLRPGGVLAIVDLDVRHRPYGDWMRGDLPKYDADEVDRFFTRMGFSRQNVETRWRFTDRRSLESVLRIEFSARVADRAVREVPGLEFPVGYRVLTRRKPMGLIVR
ncbi:methyltransferase family protein [Actinophytocola oryzae]|uniref:Methyltransferase family protein n=1 Tax=Actinophytocola oryzae TaxID=502181 RepID=A0A4R7UT29_9PSEU|nr:class I SAM-dependent methyltransferase [Actinophytocola oryzae]TDV39749.1 methyltransferase family protein [Actinophytocola oryzae]